MNKTLFDTDPAYRARFRAELRKAALGAYNDHAEDMVSDLNYRAAASKNVKCVEHDYRDGVCVACGVSQ